MFRCWRARCAPFTNSLQPASSDTQSPYEKSTNKRNGCCGCHTLWLRAALTRYSFTDTAPPLLTYDIVYFSYLRFNFIAAEKYLFFFFFQNHFWVHLILAPACSQIEFKSIVAFSLNLSNWLFRIWPAESRWYSNFNFFLFSLPTQNWILSARDRRLVSFTQFMRSNTENKSTIWCKQKKKTTSSN